MKIRPALAALTLTLAVVTAATGAQAAVSPHAGPASALASSSASGTPAAGANDPTTEPTEEPTEEPVEGGYLGGDISAAYTNEVVACAVECLDKYGNVSSFLEEPDVYRTDLTRKSGVFSTKNLVDPGQYRIWVSATIYSPTYGLEPRGFLRAVDDGYVLEPDFEDGDVFTIEAYTDLEIDPINLQIKGDPYTTAYPDNRFSTFGPNLMLDIIGKTVMEGTVLIVKSYGCGKLRKVVKIRKSGNFRHRWNDSDAYKNYGKEMVMAIIAKFDDGKKRTLVKNLDYDVSDFGWTCP